MNQLGNFFKFKQMIMKKATPNSDKDIERAIHEMVQSGELGKQIGIRLVPGSNTVDNYIKKGADFLKKSLKFNTSKLSKTNQESLFFADS